VACRYDSTTGLTRLLRFGDRLDDRRMAVLRDEPLHVFAGAGYDGQYYAQLAIDPDLSKPEVQGMMDYPRYRPRRMLLSAVVHVLTGFGASPWLTLHVYALANVVVWLALGGWLWRRVAGDGPAGTAVWLACMLSLGALDSVRLALTDLPATFLVLLAVTAVELGRSRSALVALAAAALTRDTTLLAVPAVAAGSLRVRRTWIEHAINTLVIAAPLAAWTLWINTQIAAGTVTGFNHFAFPFVGLVHQLATCGRELLAGNLDSRYLFGFIAVFSFGWQAVYVLRRCRLETLAVNPWLRVGLPFALFYFVIGDAVWNGYWAVARTCLPLTFAFNLLVLQARGRGFGWQLAAGNLCALHGLYRLLPEG